MGLFADLYSASLTDDELIEGINYPKRSIPPSSKKGLPTKRSKGNSAPPSIVTPNHSFFNQTVIKNTDPQVAVVCLTPNQSLLETLPDKELIESHCNHGSKIARSQNGFNGSQIVSDLKTDLKTSQEKVGELRYRLKVATKFAADKSRELESKSKEVEALAAELSESKLWFANEVKAAREEGYRAGRADKVPSLVSGLALNTPD